MLVFSNIVQPYETLPLYIETPPQSTYAPYSAIKNFNKNIPPVDCLV